MAAYTLQWWSWAVVTEIVYLQSQITIWSIIRNREHVAFLGTTVRGGPRARLGAPRVDRGWGPPWARLEADISGNWGKSYSFFLFAHGNCSPVNDTTRLSLAGGDFPFPYIQISSPAWGGSLATLPVCDAIFRAVLCVCMCTCVCVHGQTQRNEWAWQWGQAVPAWDKATHNHSGPKGWARHMAKIDLVGEGGVPLLPQHSMGVPPEAAHSIRGQLSPIEEDHSSV